MWQNTASWGIKTKKQVDKTLWNFKTWTKLVMVTFLTKMDTCHQQYRSFVTSSPSPWSWKHLGTASHTVSRCWFSPSIYTVQVHLLHVFKLSPTGMEVPSFLSPRQNAVVVWTHGLAITTTLLITHSLLHFPSIHTRTLPPPRGRNTKLYKKSLHSVEPRPYNYNLVYIILHTKNQFMYTIQASDHSSAHSSLTQPVSELPLT